MIIDIAYIKNVLNTEVNDTVINYLIKHFFNDICQKIKIDSTLEEEEIVTENLTYSNYPNIIEDDLTLFQETIIYAIGCDLTQTEQLQGINPDVQEKYKDEIQIESYCDIYNYCLDMLDKILNQLSQVEYIRTLFRLDVNEISDDELAFLIQHYTNYLMSYLPEDTDITTESPLFKQALYMQIACHIFKLNPTSIVSPKSYKVDEVRETFVLDFYKSKKTWCDLAEEAFADLKKKAYGLYGLYAYDRPGARTKYGYHGPGGRG